MSNSNPKKSNYSFLFELVSDFWFTTNSDPDLADIQKGKWYHFSKLILLECSLAVLTFFATISFASFMGAIEVGSTLLFMHFLPILSGLLLGVILVCACIKKVSKEISDIWKRYIHTQETKRILNKEALIKYQERPSPEKNGSQPTIESKLAESVGNLFEVASTIITALIQFIPCMLILFIISPILPAVTVFICLSLLFICYQIAKIMQDSQNTYVLKDNELLTYQEKLTNMATSIAMDPNYTEYAKIQCLTIIKARFDATKEYRDQKFIFDIFCELTQKTIIYGPYLIFGYYAIQVQMTMAEFTMLVNTFIQAAGSLMKINDIQTLIVSSKSVEELYLKLKDALATELKPAIDPIYGHKDITFACKVLAKNDVYKIRINNQANHKTFEKYNFEKLIWENFNEQGLVGDYCLDGYNQDKQDEPILINDKNLQELPEQTEMVFSNTYQYLHEPEFTIPLGRKVLLKGNSGTGKSILLKTASGNYPYGYGKIYLPETSRIAFFPQDSVINMQYTFRDELIAALPDDEKNNIKDEVIVELLNKYIGDTSLKFSVDGKNNTKSIHEPIGELSGGQKNRFVICRLLLRDPSKLDLITLDESFANVSDEFELKYLRDIYDRFPNTTILTISHQGVSDDMLRLHDNIIKFELTDTSKNKTQPSLNDKHMFSQQPMQTTTKISLIEAKDYHIDQPAQNNQLYSLWSNWDWSSFSTSSLSANQ